VEVEVELSIGAREVGFPYVEPELQVLIRVELVLRVNRGMGSSSGEDLATNTWSCWSLPEVDVVLAMTNLSLC
jgi:hypothetical protein